jgi:hypothetical protein
MFRNAKPSRRVGPTQSPRSRRAEVILSSGFADRVRSPAAHIVRRPRTAAPVRAPDRAAAPAAGHVRGARRGLWRRAPRPALLLPALPYVGARRLEHLRSLVGDPLVRRFAGLARVPTARTVSNWLLRFTQETLRPLVRLNQELVLDTLARLKVPRHPAFEVRANPSLPRCRPRSDCADSAPLPHDLRSPASWHARVAA